MLQFHERATHQYGALYGEESPSAIIVLKQILLNTDHTQDQCILRATPNFRHGPWHDTVQCLTFNHKLEFPGESKLRHRPLIAPSGEELKYEPDFHRFFLEVRFIFFFGRLHV